MQSQDFADPYVVLGVSRMVTPDELKRAYRKLSLAWHPDRHASASEAEQQEATRRFTLVNAAYVAIGEMLREKSTAAPVAETAAQSDRRVVEQSDIRAEAIRAVVSSAALRVAPKLQRHAFRRVIGVVEQLLLDTLAVGDRAFLGGFDAALRDAMLIIGMDDTLRGDALNVLDAAADELQWRGRGADPKTWQELLRPLERARGRLPTPSPSATAPRQRRQESFDLDALLRPEPLLMVGQSALAFLALLLLLPLAPVGLAPRLVLLLADLAVLGYLTFGFRRP